MVNARESRRIGNILTIVKLIKELKDKERVIHYEGLVAEIQDKMDVSNRVAKDYINCALFKLKINRSEL